MACCKCCKCCGKCCGPNCCGVGCCYGKWAMAWGACLMFTCFGIPPGIYLWFKGGEEYGEDFLRNN